MDKDEDNRPPTERPYLRGDFSPGELSHSSMLALLLRVRNGRRHPLFNRPESSKEKGYDR